MNEARQKAIELVKKFKPFMYPFGAGSAYLTGDTSGNNSLSDAKECATIVVDEMLALYDRDYQDKRDKTYWHPYDYWVEVKARIQDVCETELIISQK